MSKKGRIAIIVEGKSREVKYLRSLQKYYFASIEMDVLALPAEQNIYMLWKRLKEDEMETDLIEIVRESSKDSAEKLEGLRRDEFMEVYLLFDFDPHQNNLKIEEGRDFVSVLRSMVDTFNNETETGKLCLSYPMVESLRDITMWSCLPYYQCKISLTEVPQYKNLSGDRNPYADVRKYTLEIWEILVAIFLTRCKCLFDQTISYDKILAWYKKEVSPLTVLDQQLKIFCESSSVFILNALPELLLDYFGEDYWVNLVNSLRKISNKGCMEGDIK